MLNNVLLCSIAAVVITGTMYPLVADLAVRRTRSRVGAPFFNATVLPLALPRVRAPWPSRPRWPGSARSSARRCCGCGGRRWPPLSSGSGRLRSAPQAAWPRAGLRRRRLAGRWAPAPRSIERIRLFRIAARRQPGPAARPAPANLRHHARPCRHGRHRRRHRRHVAGHRARRAAAPRAKARHSAGYTWTLEGVHDAARPELRRARRHHRDHARRRHCRSPARALPPHLPRPAHDHDRGRHPDQRPAPTSTPSWARSGTAPPCCACTTTRWRPGSGSARW